MVGPSGARCQRSVGGIVLKRIVVLPRILDNLSADATLLAALRSTLELSERADFCVGYFNLRGWRHVDRCVERWREGGGQARVLVGMQRLPHDQLRDALNPLDEQRVDNRTAQRLRQQLAEQFRSQLLLGMPTNADEAALRRLVRQLQSVERHVLRNYVFLHALRAGQPLPIGTQDCALLDSSFADADAGQAAFPRTPATTRSSVDAESFDRRAAEVYARYRTDCRQGSAGCRRTSLPPAEMKRIFDPYLEQLDPKIEGDSLSDTL